MSKIIQITNSADFEKEIAIFEDAYKNIKEIFKKERTNTEKINGTNEIWTGKTQEIIYEKKIDFQKNFEPIEEALEIYINFLKKTLDDFKRYEISQNKNIDSNDYTLDVNS